MITLIQNFPSGQVSLLTKKRLLRAFVFAGFFCFIPLAHSTDIGPPSEVDLEFDGFSSRRIVIPHNASLNPEKENWTMEFWFKMNADASGNLKFLSARASRSDDGFYIGKTQWAVSCSEGQSARLRYSGDVPVDEWAHMAVQIDRDNDKLRVFINGRRVAEVDSPLKGSINPASELVVGGDIIGSFQGIRARMSDLRIWKGVTPSEPQIRENMRLGIELQGKEGLAGYWPMNENTGRVVADVVDNHDGEIAGEAIWRDERTFLKNLPPSVNAEGLETLTLGPVALASPEGDVTYQWYFDGKPVEGGHENVLTVTDMREENLGTYYVVVDDARALTPLSSQRTRVAMPDWPMWRFDPARSANSPLELSESLYLQWVRELPSPQRAWRPQIDDGEKLAFDASYTPVAVKDRLFVPSNVNDSLTAYSMEDGGELWRFYADGPVRLAPTVWKGSVYFVSDDGYLYCLDTDTGKLKWKFRGGPSEHRLLGNERIINFWAARGGPVVDNAGTLYFGAGLWPMHGVFIYALDAQSGEVLWVNDTMSSDYVQAPHSRAYGYGGIVPQGYFAVGETRLVVGGGRTYPAFLDRFTGEFLSARLRSRGRESGGYDVNAVKMSGVGMLRNNMLQNRVEMLSDQINGEVFYKLAARDRLFVTTMDGTLYCFGPDRKPEPVVHEYSPAPLSPQTERWSKVASELIGTPGGREGYALMLGAGSGDLLKELIAGSDLHVVVVEPDPVEVLQLRDELAAAGLYGRRAAVIESDIAAFSVQPYLFGLIVSEDAVGAGVATDKALLESLFNLLRPYTGVAWLGASGEELNRLADMALQAEVDRVSVKRVDDHVFAMRTGPLTGAGEWTHQYHNSANTLLSEDQRVRLPLGVLWFGGPNNHNILPRHAAGPKPQVAGGRQAFLGVETFSARCVYTGRALWEREFPGIGHPFTSLPLEERWAGGELIANMPKIPGATYIGSPFVTLQDSIYLRYNGAIYRLNPDTGETIGKFSPPGRSVQEIYGDEAMTEWGHISVSGDYLITTSEPHMFEDQALGWHDSYSGTSSRRLAVMNRYDGNVLWEREAETGFRHMAIVSSDETVYVIDGLSQNALNHLARRGKVPETGSGLMALKIDSGEEIWRTESKVFGTYLLYSREHDILIEGGSQDVQFPRNWVHAEDEPRGVAARNAGNGEIIWQRGGVVLPGALRGENLFSGRPGGLAVSILTGETLLREQPHTGRSSNWSFSRAYGCNLLNASKNLLLFRTGVAGYFDLEHDTGTGNFSGFRSGCTANMIAADGVLNALDYTRTCSCNYPQKTSLAMIHMPGDSNIEFWTRYAGSPPNPAEHGINFGAPGRRVDVAAGSRVWYDRDGNHRRHPSAIKDNGGGLDWVAASVREGEGDIALNDLLEANYTVRLHFAELEAHVEPGDRVFDVLLNGEAVLSGYDIVERTGGVLRGAVEAFEVDVKGELTVTLRSKEGTTLEPVISGIELVADGKGQ